MKSSDTSARAGDHDGKLSIREWIALSSIGLVTILLLPICTELAARWLYPVAQVGFENCFVTDDPSGTAPVKPHGICSERIVESRLPVEYRFNGHGDREAVELQPKQPGARRIVMIGSSMAMGLFVPQELTFAAMLPTELSQLTGRPIELYNMATGGKYRGGPFPTPGSARRFSEVFSAEPDIILWVITPMDLENVNMENANLPAQMPATTGVADGATSTPTAGARSKLTNAPANGTLEEKLQQKWEQTRAFLVLRHLLLGAESQSQYVNSYLRNEDDAGFLRTTPSIKWQSSLRTLGADAEQFAKEAKSAGVPFVAVLIPNRAQAAMISHGEWPAGYDPYKLGNDLRSLIEADGGIYIDILPDLRGIPNPEQRYFPVDGHLDVDGHAMIAKSLAKEMAGGALPDLTAATSPPAALAVGN